MIDWQLLIDTTLIVQYYLFIIIGIRYIYSIIIYIYHLDVPESDIYRQRGPLRQPDLTGESCQNLGKKYDFMFCYDR